MTQSNCWIALLSFLVVGLTIRCVQLQAEIEDGYSRERELFENIDWDAFTGWHGTK